MAANAAHPSSLAKRTLCRQTPEVGAGCPNRARPVLCGGRSEMSVPTANAAQGRKRNHNADEIMAEIVAKRLVEDLKLAGFVIMKRPAIGGGATLGRGFER